MADRFAVLSDDDAREIVAHVRVALAAVLAGGLRLDTTDLALKRKAQSFPFQSETHHERLRAERAIAYPVVDAHERVELAVYTAARARGADHATALADADAAGADLRRAYEDRIRQRRAALDLLCYKHHRRKLDREREKEREQAMKEGYR